MRQNPMIFSSYENIVKGEIVLVLFLVITLKQTSESQLRFSSKLSRVPSRCTPDPHQPITPRSHSQPAQLSHISSLSGAV